VSPLPWGHVGDKQGRWLDRQWLTHFSGVLQTLRAHSAVLPGPYQSPYTRAALCTFHNGAAVRPGTNLNLRCQRLLAVTFTVATSTASQIIDSGPSVVWRGIL